MPKRDGTSEVIARWMGIPDQLRKAVRGIPDEKLSRRARPDQMSIRETVHHLVEANLVASNIIIAALAKSGSTYDWTWVTPGGSWMRRLGYNKAPVEPALATLSALSRHIAAILSVSPGRLRRRIELFDAPGAPRYTKTVAQILLDEVSHAQEHLEALPLRRVPAGGRRGRRTSA